MRKLETYVNEKLRVTKGPKGGPIVPDLIAILESKDIEEYESRCQQLLEYLKNDSNLPVAELKDSENSFMKLARKYQKSNDTFLFVLETFIYYGTWDNRYSMDWSNFNNSVRNIIDKKGFSDFVTYDKEIYESGGVYIITENTELLEQIDYLIEKAEPEV